MGGPHRVCTFHVRGSLDHRLWQDGLPRGRRGPLVRAIGNAIESAPGAADAEAALDAALAMAEGHRWRHTARHLREVRPHIATWLRVDPGGAISHTTSLLERTMREVNRRVDPVGVRWSLAGAEAIVAVLLARRLAHPRWRRLCRDSGVRSRQHGSGEASTKRLAIRDLERRESGRSRAPSSKG